MKYGEEEVKRLVIASNALLEAPPGEFDPVEARRLALELDALIQDIQYMEGAATETDREYFDWLEANIPEMFNINGRPHWIESEKVMGQDKALLKEFEETLNRNIAANGGKKHRASQKTYADLADSYGDDEYTVKQRVMRARRRQKALKTVQDILGMAAQGQTDGDNVVTPEEYKRRGEELLEAFRRILKTK